MFNKSSRKFLHGFTLIELLVVISIIAVLMSIMVPALSRARQMAAAVVCNAHLRQAGVAIATYSNAWDDWLAGPNTSGASISNTKGANIQDNMPPTSPIQNCDWVSPILGDDLGLSANRAIRFEEIANAKFKCPSNRVKYDFEYGGSLLRDIQNTYTVSYGALLPFHFYSKHNSRYPSQKWVKDNEISAQNIEVSPSYVPKLGRIGRPQDKVFATDGVRYVRAGQISINAFGYQDDGGNYMHCGPVANNSGDPFVTDDAKKFAYRHGGKLNAVFFDGHTETLGFEDSLKAGLYWPTGSRIINANYVRDANVRSGDVIK